MEKDISSLEHTRWRCQYHVVFAPKYRRMTIYGEIRADIGKILRKLCEQKGVEISEQYTVFKCANTNIRYLPQPTLTGGLFHMLPQPHWCALPLFACFRVTLL